MLYLGLFAGVLLLLLIRYIKKYVEVREQRDIYLEDNKNLIRQLDSLVTSSNHARRVWTRLREKHGTKADYSD